MEKRILFFTPDGEHELEVVIYFKKGYDDYGIEGSQWITYELEEFILFEDKKDVTDMYYTWSLEWQELLDGEIEMSLY